VRHYEVFLSRISECQAIVVGNGVPTHIITGSSVTFSGKERKVHDDSLVRLSILKCVLIIGSNKRKIDLYSTHSTVIMSFRNIRSYNSIALDSSRLYNIAIH
jgi:hypothetical protein